MEKVKIRKKTSISKSSQQLITGLTGGDLSYPLPPLIGYPVINTKNKELLYLYLPKAQEEYMKKVLSPLGRVAKDSEVLPRLKTILLDYYIRVFKVETLEKRIEKSYSNEMKQIITYVSLILIPDEKFKGKKIVEEQLQNFRNITNLVRKESNIEMSEDHPFLYYFNQTNNYSNNNNNNTRTLLNKEAFSLMVNKNNNDELIELNKSQNGNNIENKDTIIKIDLDHFFTDDEEEEIKQEEEEKEIINYKEYLKELFCNRITDFRSDIVEFCIENDLDFQDSNFEKFVCYIEFFTMLFTGLRVKYYIDEFSNLDLDFYGKETTYMDLAETFHYQVQFRIQDIPIIGKKDGSFALRDGKEITLSQYFLTKQKKVNELNGLQYHDYNLDYIEEYPPYASFIKALADKFRRYDKNDFYHICDDCESLIDYRQTYNLNCSSCFRCIDKARITYASLSTIFDIDYIKTSISKKEGEIDRVIKNLIYVPNYECLRDSIKFSEMVHAYCTPFNDTRTKKMNRILRCTFGEKIGYFYSWITHYVLWSCFPAIIGILYRLIKPLIIYYGFGKNIILGLNLSFAGLIVLWGNYYVVSWEKREILYNYIWGMDHFKLEKTNDMIISNEGETVEIFMSVKIPIYDKFKALIRDIISFLIVVSTLFGTVIVNLLIFYVQNLQMYNKEKTDSLIEPENKINSIWLYIVPVAIYITRELLSKLYNKLNKWVTDKENYLTKSEYRYSLLKKQLCFEFFNYYFNLYYIAFGKRYFEICAYNDCFQELGNQLTMIIISDITVVASKTIFYFIHKRKQKKKIDKTILEKYTYSDNHSKKYIYYTRKQFGDSDISKAMMPIIFNFGYVIQFGVCSKISFAFMFLLTIFLRLATGFTMKYLVYVKSLNESKGIDIFNKVQEIMAFLGIISNLCIIFYTNKHFIPLKRSKKLILLIITENIIFLILKLINYVRVPNWFEFKNKVEVKYLKKYGIRSKSIGNVLKNKEEKKIDEINEKENDDENEDQQEIKKELNELGPMNEK